MKLKYLRNVVTLELVREKCVGCGICPSVCPRGVLEMENRRAKIIDRDACMECGACAMNCSAKAILVKAGVGCASAVITGWLTGREPSCGCEESDSTGCCC